MSVTQQQVLDSLARVMSPRGVALSNAGVLSAITVNDGKVLFSINVDAAEARAWESTRAEAEAAVRAIPGVTVAMIALTAERKAGPAAPPPPHRHAAGVPHVSSHRPPQSPVSPMSKQSEIPGVAAVIADITIGPRQIIAVSSSTRKPIDITASPKRSIGIIFRSSLSSGFSRMPVSRGTDGP